MTYKTPGVYIEEIRKLPPSIAAVETAIPVFIGYTQQARLKEDDDLIGEPHRIKSLFDYERLYGKASPEQGLSVDINTVRDETNAKIEDPSPYVMYYGLQAFFGNGGGPCYIISVDLYSEDNPPVIELEPFQDALAEAAKVDEITLIVMPDALGLPTAADYYALQKEAIDQCVKLQDRFTVMDIWEDPENSFDDNIALFRGTLTGVTDELKYAAVYAPRLDMVFDYEYNEEDVTVTVDGNEQTLAELKDANNAQFNQARQALGSQVNVSLPPSPAMVGIYANVDNTRGVWKAPANVGVDFTVRPQVKITDEDQKGLNVDAVAGKSVNAIRAFTGRGILVWGARTLAGNDNEWRYVSVRRFYNMVEESVKNATQQFVFEPNDINTWTRVKGMIENFLVQQWKAGALMGVTPEQAFFVKVGLNETMDQIDVFEGRMIVEIGMAVVRPAEFIILRFSHKMLSES